MQFLTISRSGRDPAAMINTEGNDLGRVADTMVFHDGQGSQTIRQCRPCILLFNASGVERKAHVAQGLNIEFDDIADLEKRIRNIDPIASRQIGKITLILAPDDRLLSRRIAPQYYTNHISTQSWTFTIKPTLIRLGYG